MAAIGYVALTLEVHREGRQFVSRCRELGTASCGDTLDEAFENIKDATIEYLNAIEQLGERPRIFREKGIKTRKKPPSVVRQEYELAPGAFVGSYVTKVPVPAWVPRLPLVSSRELLAALRRLGFETAPKSSGGSHLSLYRKMGDRTDVTTIVLGRKEVPRGTLKDILKLGRVSHEEFVRALRKKR
jgi:predicted RNA binding protein YcfA (HicA-like mRNA interferase family)/predicted RNase H-like HicB family nuclease